MREEPGTVDKPVATPETKRERDADRAAHPRPVCGVQLASFHRGSRHRPAPRSVIILLHLMKCNRAPMLEEAIPPLNGVFSPIHP
jgi:hypothetical protein